MFWFWTGSCWKSRTQYSQGEFQSCDPDHPSHQYIEEYELVKEKQANLCPPGQTKKPCEDFTKAGQCNNQGGGCRWNKRLSRCNKAAAPAPAKKTCEDITKPGLCNKTEGCRYVNVKKKCIEGAAKPKPSPSDQTSGAC